MVPNPKSWHGTKQTRISRVWRISWLGSEEPEFILTRASKWSFKLGMRKVQIIRWTTPFYPTQSKVSRRITNERESGGWLCNVSYAQLITQLLNYFPSVDENNGKWILEFRVSHSQYTWWLCGLITQFKLFKNTQMFTMIIPLLHYYLGSEMFGNLSNIQLLLHSGNPTVTHYGLNLSIKMRFTPRK